MTQRQLPTNTSWDATNLQLLAFPTDPLTGLDSDWWRELTGSDPEVDVRRKSERAVDGPFNGHGLRLQIEPVRITWTAGPLLSPELAAVTTIPTVGAFSAAAVTFRDLMDRWLSGNCPPLKRLAFVGQLFLGCPDRTASYNALNEFLNPWVKVDPNSSDFQYRVNRKRPSEAYRGEINRLQTWSALRYHVEANIGSTVQQVAESFGCLLQFDFNTQPTDEELPIASLTAIYHELIDLVTEVATEGDIA